MCKATAVGRATAQTADKKFQDETKAEACLAKRQITLRVFSRMRSEGFSFNSGGLAAEPCSRPVVSMFATVRDRSRPDAVER